LGLGRARARGRIRRLRIRLRIRLANHASHCLGAQAAVATTGRRFVRTFARRGEEARLSSDVITSGSHRAHFGDVLAELVGGRTRPLGDALLADELPAVGVERLALETDHAVVQRQ
jgi:hypothetical protein